MSDSLPLTDVCPGPGHPDGALCGGDPVHVPLRPDAHAGPHRERGLQTLLDGPLHLLDMLEILRNILELYFSSDTTTTTTIHHNTDSLKESIFLFLFRRFKLKTLGIIRVEKLYDIVLT